MKKEVHYTGYEIVYRTITYKYKRRRKTDVKTGLKEWNYPER